METDNTYRLIFKLVNDLSFRQAYIVNSDQALINEGITDSFQALMIKNFIQPFLQQFEINQKVQERQIEEMQEHYDVVSKLRKGINETIRQMLQGYQMTMIMYSVSFYLGVVLIILSVIFAFTEGKSLLPIVFAGLGMADIIAHFISGPPLKLQKSRSDLAQLQAAYFIWYNEFRNWNSYLIDEYYRYKAKFNNPELAFSASSEYENTLQKVSDILMKNTNKILSDIEKFVEKDGENSKESEKIEKST